MNSAADIWQTLKNHFSQPDDTRICNLQYSLCNITQDTRPVDSYFTKLNGIWEELKNYRPLPYCECGKCTQSCFQKYIELWEKDRVFRFLNGLNESFSALRSHIIMIKPFPSLDEAYNLVLREESQRSILMQSQPLLDTTVVAVVTESKIRVKNEVVCSHCAKNGHVKEKCYCIIGFPPDFKFTKGKGNFSRKAMSAVANSTNQSQVENQED
ncbi:Uncharacterized protein TCM_019740 [Theobroma cacao]|uniref:Uncharacterized protein n=1 Tax=Theobroma cacao TaxID=3641 RepID=A0A061EQ90_THECC|nr:Uncharacterized protein TCM_019740 [Theobroma cacao]